MCNKYLHHPHEMDFHFHFVISTEFIEKSHGLVPETFFTLGHEAGALESSSYGLEARVLILYASNVESSSEKFDQINVRPLLTVLQTCAHLNGLGVTLIDPEKNSN